jgi:putative thioredoxin
MGIFDIFKKNGSGEARRLAIMDVTDANFQQQVIERSFKSAVMVDYWAAWCGPCLRLGPILEKVAEEPDQTFILAKLNTETNPQTAFQFQIQSIPAVKMFRNGKVIGQFIGAMPEPVIRKFIKEMTTAKPPTDHLNITDNPAKRLAEAEKHLKQGRGFEAFVWLNWFPESEQAETAEKLLPLARFLMDVADGDALTGIEALDEAYLKTAELLRKQKTAEALEQLVLARDLGEEMDRLYTEEVLEGFSALLGEGHKSVEAYRGRL